MSALAEALTAPLAAASLLLVLAGLPKVVRPDDLRRALRQAGLPVPTVLVRAGGAAEAALGVAALLVGGRVLAASVAVSYAAFTAFVVLALRRGWALSTCGCFGKEDTPPSPLHAAVTGAVATVAAGSAIAGTPALLVALGGLPALGLPLVALSGLVAWLLYLALTAVPRLGVRVAAMAVGRGVTGSAGPAAFRLLPLTDVSPRRAA